MNRLSDELFVKEQPNPDIVTGIRIKNGDFFLLAYMEDAEHYRIKQAKTPGGYEIFRPGIVGDGELDCSPADNNMYVLYETDDNGNPINPEEAKYENAYAYFLTLINPYERNGVTDGDHDIFELSKDELSSICDALRDGDYVLIINE